MGSSELTELNLMEKDMIRGVVELSETQVKEIMVPRIDVIFLDEDIPQDELVQKIMDTGHSRFPVYKETIDNVTGVLYVKDLVSHLLQQNDLHIKTIQRKPYFVPESMKLDALLMELKQRKVHIAIAVDEFGGISGIVCLEDILEEIVGDIQDEFDNEEEEILKLDEGTWLCDARINMEDLMDEIQVQLPYEDYDTLGGFVFSLFGKIPVRYEKVCFAHLDFIIQTVEGHKIKKIKVIASEKKP
ncbi:MAG: hemolysin family protein [Spirochaetaceae bacterium]|nr:hemolysin family protein [Spirochaetaceae bacterium]